MGLSSLSKTASITASTASTVSAGFGPDTTNKGLTATGGDITEFSIGNATYRAHTFNNSGSFVVSELGSTYSNIELLVVGAGTGARLAYGGGAGQVLYYGPEQSGRFTRRVAVAGTELTGTAVGTYAVVIGAGGAANQTLNTYSSSSSFIGPNINVTATGGQMRLSSQGKTYTISGNGIQSAGGGSNSGTNSGAGATGQGGIVDGSNYYAACGGPGMYFSIAGGATLVGGGGSYGINSGYGATMVRTRGEENFGGGRGDEAGWPNTGGGGGGGWNGSGAKAGGSGVVIVKYRIR